MDMASLSRIVVSAAHAHRLRVTPAGHGNTHLMNHRALNRATLARQLLLRRSAMSVPEALEHLVGIQAQTASTWYTGLWSRLEGFQPEEVSRLLVERSIVRTALMRSTLHLVTAEDALRLRPLVQPALERPMTGYARKYLKEVHSEEVAAAGRAILEGGPPLTFIQLGKELAERWPEATPSDLAMTVRVYVPVVQVPPRGLWGASGAAAHTTLESWLARPLESGHPMDDLVLRYLGAFGPATPGDMQAWSGLAGLREVFERLRPRLETFRDDAGRELFDLPDAPRPDADTPAPPRFLYDFENLMVSHADRSRFVTDERRKHLLSVANRFSYGNLLVDGFVVGIWRIEREGDTALLSIKLAERLSEQDKQEIAEEGERLLEFWAPDAPHEARFSDAKA